MVLGSETHEHCRMCINLIKCRKWTSKATSACDLVHCHLDCGATFHACKEDEHRLLCSREKVKCINAGYGCPVVLERRDKGKHLKLCPASVVHCTMTYDHWPIPLVENVSMASGGDMINNKDHSSQSDNKVISSSASSLHLSTFSDISVSVRNSCLLWKSFKPFTLNPKELYTFSCARDFQRLEYEWHFRNTHSDLQSCLYDWVEQWCPLAQYGCKFTRQRLQPCLQVNNNCQPKGPSKVVYSHLLKAFGMSENDHQSHKKKHDGVPNGGEEFLPEDLFSRLPSEVLLVIASHLDSFSLNNLSLTSRRFYSICQSLLTQKGIVLPCWEKTKENSSWKITSYRWQFSVACAPVHSWSITDCPPMSVHLQQCPHFASCLPTKGNSLSQDEEENKAKHALLLDVVNEYASKYTDPDQRCKSFIKFWNVTDLQV